jgi:hypothetical protein
MMALVFSMLYYGLSAAGGTGRPLAGLLSLLDFFEMRRYDIHDD